jgi:hypothetical protein
MLSKQDKLLIVTDTRQKGHCKIMSYQGGEEKNTHTLRYVDMCKWQRVIPRHKGSPRYRIAHGWKNECGSLNLETLKFLMHFREPGSLFYFYSYSHIFSFSHTYIFFFISFFLLSFSLSIFSFSFSSKFFYLLPFEL